VPFIFIDYVGSILTTKSIKLQFVGNEERICLVYENFSSRW
jgi:hypothetical protein